MPSRKGQHQDRQGQGLRKLRALLQHWWQGHSQRCNPAQAPGDGLALLTQKKLDFQSDCRDSYLSCALLFGAAHYLTKINQHPDWPAETSFAASVKVLQDLWPRALPQTISAPLSKRLSQILASGLIEDEGLQKEFLSLTMHSQLQQLFHSPLLPSFIYEAFSLEERRISKDLLQGEKKLVDTSHLISFTQVYTPAWVVDHLLQKTLGQTILECRDLSALKNIKLLDPALGGGVFLVQALAICVAAYENFGLSTGQATKLSLENNLFALDIDAMALATAALALILKAASLGLGYAEIEGLLPLKNIFLIEDEIGGSYPMGSLSKDLRQTPGHALNLRYDVVVANPPYLGRKLLPRPLKEQLKRHYPEAASDLSQAFLSMALDLAKPGGRVGFITQGSFLHLANAKNLREKLLKEHQLIEVVELGSGVFPLLAGEKASTALIVIRNSLPPDDQEGHFLSLVAQVDKAGLLQGLEKLEGLEKFASLEKLEVTRRQSDFLQDEDLVIKYLRPQAVMNLRSQLPKLADIATLKQGLATTDNGRFLRFIWEVEPGDIPGRYVPYARGEGGERWWSPPTTLVLWEDNGQAIKEAVTTAYPYLKGNWGWVVKNEDYYFKSGLTFSFVAKDRLAVRKLAVGAIFDVGSSAIFIHDSEREWTLLAYLNSTLATAMAHDLNPTINFQVGDLKKLIVPDFSQAEQEILASLANSCVRAKERQFKLSSPLRFFQPKCQSSEISALPSINWEACQIAQSQFTQAQEELQHCEQEIDKLVMSSTVAGCALDQADKTAIEIFCARPKARASNNLGAEKFCLISLMEALLAFFYRAACEIEARPPSLIASLKDERDADCLINLLPGTIDLSFLRAQLGPTKGLAHYFREELPRAFDDMFLGQTPLLFIKALEEGKNHEHTLIIVPPLALLHPGTIAQCGDLSGQAKARAQKLLHRARSIEGLEGLRAKEIARQIAATNTRAKTAI